jgi:hypothetical protein
MPYRKEDFSSMPFSRLVVESHVTYLNELDPTHIIKQSKSIRVSNATQTTQVRRAPLPSRVLTNISAAPVLLELDPTHLHAR